MPKNKSKQSGFGLVEVLVSITLILMVVLALHSLSQYAFYNWENAQNKTVAYNLIQSTIEDFHNTRDTNANSPGVTWSDGLTSTTAPIDVTVNGKKYTKTITVSPITVNNIAGWPNLNDSKKKVVVEISWAERSGPKSLKGATYLTDWKGKY